MAIVECSTCGQPFREVPPGVCGVCRQPTSIATAPRPDIPPAAAERSGPAASLAFPWGTHSLQSGESLNLGRDPEFSPIADRLAGFECVSRRHAVIAFSSDVFYVLDSSTNGTYIDGERIVGTAPKEARSGSIVSLAGALDVALSGQ